MATGKKSSSVSARSTKSASGTKTAQNPKVSQRTKTSQSTSRSSSRTTHSKKPQEQEDFLGEVLLWLVLALSILLFISNLGIGGNLGNAVSSLFFGMFGILAYLFPIVFAAACFFFVSNRGNRVANVKLAAAICFVCFLCMFFELILNGSAVAGAFKAFSASAKNKNGGGFIGGLLAWLICPNFGLLGAYVINTVAFIVCLVLITERSALRGVKNSGRRVYETAKFTNERHREIAEVRREEQKIRRIDKKVEGVAFDTRILPKEEKRVSDEISELRLDIPIELPEIKAENKVTLMAEEPLAAKLDITSYMPKPSQAAPVRKTETVFAVSEKETKEKEPLEPSFTKKLEEPIHLKEPKKAEAVFEKEQPKVVQLLSEQDSSVALQKKSNQSTAEMQDKSAEMQKEPNDKAEEQKQYIFPPITLLKQLAVKQGESREHLQETAHKLQQTLKNFGVNVNITNVSCGPSVTRYELQPEMGVKVSKIVNLADDIKLNLAAADIRIEAPIPGKAAVGIEVPNKENIVVSFRELVESEEFQKSESYLSFCVGRDISGKVIVTDIAKMPHLLIAGATGSGKSVCINTIIMSILYKANPKDVKLIMIDPKVVELSVYNGIPHLMIPVVTDPKKAAGALHWAVAEMSERYQKFAEVGARDLKGYNAIMDSRSEVPGEEKPEHLPQIVIIVDELADLMMVASSEVEESICRLAQLARACGIHLIIATQRPSVNVITGVIKANMPSRVAFAVTSGVDSRTILDMNGAEKLLGKGDMLFNPQGVPKPIRIQGAFVSDKEVTDVVKFLKEQNYGMVNYSAEIAAKINRAETGNTTVGIDGRGDSDGRDAYFKEAAKLLIEKEKGSIGMLQRYFKVGFNRAARIMDQLEEAGIVGPEEGTKPRKVLMTAEEFEQYKENMNEK